jgi:hypothetical protein
VMRLCALLLYCFAPTHIMFPMQTRQVEGSVEALINSLKWCGLEEDEGVFKCIAFISGRHVSVWTSCSITGVRNNFVQVQRRAAHMAHTSSRSVCRSTRSTPRSSWR